MVRVTLYIKSNDHGENWCSNYATKRQKALTEFIYSCKDCTETECTGAAATRGSWSGYTAVPGLDLIIIPSVDRVIELRGTFSVLCTSSIKCTFMTI